MGEKSNQLHCWTKIALRKLFLLDNVRFISNGKVNSQSCNVAVMKIPRNCSFTTPYKAVSAHKIRVTIRTALFRVITQCVMTITQSSEFLIYFASDA
jgi:hypothetical protein